MSNQKENLGNEITDKKTERSHKSILIEEKLIEKSGMKPGDWIAENGKNFRKIINDYPSLTYEYEKNPEETTLKIKKRLEEMKK